MGTGGGMGGLGWAPMGREWTPLTEYGEVGGAGSHGASLIPGLAVVFPCLLLSKPLEL